MSLLVIRTRLEGKKSRCHGFSSSLQVCKVTESVEKLMIFIFAFSILYSLIMQPYTEVIAFFAPIREVS